MKLSDILKDIRRVHVELQDRGARGHNNGICHNVYLRAVSEDMVASAADHQDLYFQWDDHCKDWFRSWPLFSGRAAYPIVGVKEDLSRFGQDCWSDDVQHNAVLAFDYAPKWRGITGYQRAQLLDHCIRCAEAAGL